MSNTLEKFRSIKNFIFDVDGVLTDSTLLVTEEGHLLRTMNVRDGFALKVAVKSGFNVCIITGGSSQGVKKRLEGLGIKDIFLAAHPKIEVFTKYMTANNLVPAETLYCGDDIIDIEVMKEVGLATCPSDAIPEVKNISQYVCSSKGGQGCAREIIEKVMKLHDLWPGQKYL